MPVECYRTLFGFLLTLGLTSIETKGNSKDTKINITFKHNCTYVRTYEIINHRQLNKK